MSNCTKMSEYRSSNRPFPCHERWIILLESGLRWRRKTGFLGTKKKGIERVLDLRHSLRRVYCLEPALQFLVYYRHSGKFTLGHRQKSVGLISSHYFNPLLTSRVFTLSHMVCDRSFNNQPFDSPTIWKLLNSSWLCCEFPIADPYGNFPSHMVSTLRTAQQLF